MSIIKPEKLSKILKRCQKREIRNKRVQAILNQTENNNLLDYLTQVRSLRDERDIRKIIQKLSEQSGKTVMFSQKANADIKCLEFNNKFLENLMEIIANPLSVQTGHCEILKNNQGMSMHIDQKNRIVWTVAQKNNQEVITFNSLWGHYD